MTPWWIPPRAWSVSVLAASTLWGVVVYVTDLPVSVALMLGIPLGYLAAAVAARA